MGKFFLSVFQGTHKENNEIAKVMLFGTKLNWVLNKVIFFKNGRLNFQDYQDGTIPLIVILQRSICSLQREIHHMGWGCVLRKVKI